MKRITNNKTVLKKPNKRINTPFGYFGSKNKIALQLCKNLPPHNCWVEAFCGSAAVTLFKVPAPIEIINDIDNEIVNLFYQLRENSEKLCKSVSLTPYASEELINARKTIKEDNSLERARKFLIKSMMAINGVFGEQKGGFSTSNSYSRNFREARVNRWYNLPERLTTVVERLKSIRIENMDARRLLKKFINRPATLVYLDPPYFTQRTNGYNIDANNENFHYELLEIAVKSRCMLFISGYENDLYNSILKVDDGWHKRKIETFTKDSKGNRHKRNEVVWTNKYFQNAMKTNQIPIELSKKEKSTNKINPERD